MFHNSDAEMMKGNSTFPSLPRASSFLLFSGSDDETHSMLSSVVASRSVSSDNANLFFAAETRCTGWIVMLYKKINKLCFKVRNISSGSDSNSVGWQQPTQKRALISGLAQLTKTNLQLQHSTWQVEKKMEEDNDIFSHRGVLNCHCLILPHSEF